MSPRFDPTLLPAAPDLSYESKLWGEGTAHIAGIDEAGRGSLAGPVTVSAVILPADLALLKLLDGVRDSKQLTPTSREIWAEQIKSLALTWGVGFASAEEIDYFNIIYAIQLAAHRALAALSPAPEHLLIDYIFLPDEHTPQTALIKGDARSLSIASASILAKTARDAHLRALESEYPGYGLINNKGYCTPEHLEALNRLGPTAIHRRSYAPVKNIEIG